MKQDKGFRENSDRRKLYGRPPIEFSQWANWSERDSLGHALEVAGVYLLAHFENLPPGSADPKNPQIVYIGETHDQTLRDRLGAFHRSAFQGKDGHAGGETYRTKFPGDTGKNLYVSIFPPKVMINPTLHRTFIMYLESALRWEFAEANRRLPACNKE
jgi:hypothetical protein